MRLCPAGTASYEASRWLILQIARRVVKQCFYIFTAWMTRKWLIMLYLICSIQPLSEGWFNAAALWRYHFLLELFVPLCNFISLFWNMFPCAVVCKRNCGGGHAAEKEGILWSSQLICVSRNYAVKIASTSFFFCRAWNARSDVLQLSTCNQNGA